MSGRPLRPPRNFLVWKFFEYGRLDREPTTGDADSGVCQEWPCRKEERMVVRWMEVEEASTSGDWTKEACGRFGGQSTGDGDAYSGHGVARQRGPSGPTLWVPAEAEPAAVSRSPGYYRGPSQGPCGFLNRPLNGWARTHHGHGLVWLCPSALVTGRLRSFSVTSIQLPMGAYNSPRHLTSFLQRAPFPRNVRGILCGESQGIIIALGAIHHHCLKASKLKFESSCSTQPPHIRASHSLSRVRLKTGAQRRQFHQASTRSSLNPSIARKSRPLHPVASSASHLSSQRSR